MASPPLDHLAVQLPVDAYHHLIHTLRRALPPPLTDGAEDLARRDHAVIARIAGLCPTNAAEADVAAQSVAASEQWKDYLRRAQAPETTPECAATCHALAHGMMRQSNSALRLLLRMQEVRARREADNAGCDSAAWTEHWAARLMVEALSPAAARAPAPEPQPPPLEPRPRPEPQPQPQVQPAPAAEPEPELIAEAEQYAAIYPERARLIRAMGRVPDDATFGPPDDDLVQALVTARTPALAALDRETAPARAT